MFGVQLVVKHCSGENDQCVRRVQHERLDDAHYNLCLLFFTTRCDSRISQGVAANKDDAAASASCFEPKDFGKCVDDGTSERDDVENALFLLVLRL